MYYSVMCVDHSVDTVSVTYHSSMDEAQTEVERLKALNLSDLYVEIGDHEGSLDTSG